MSESQDLRAFIREQSLLANRRMDHFARELAEYREAMHRHFDEQAKRTDEVIAEGRAHRAALFAILDKLTNGGAAAAG